MSVYLKPCEAKPWCLSGCPHSSSAGAAAAAAAGTTAAFAFAFGFAFALAAAAARWMSMSCKSSVERVFALSLSRWVFLCSFLIACVLALFAALRSRSCCCRSASLLAAGSSPAPIPARAAAIACPAAPAAGAAPAAPPPAAPAAWAAAIAERPWALPRRRRCKGARRAHTR